jgi:hypothetical protein
MSDWEFLAESIAGAARLGDGFRLQACRCKGDEGASSEECEEEAEEE